MLDIYLAVLLAFATKEIYNELYWRFQLWKDQREINDWIAFSHQIEDEEADDEDDEDYK
jgi:hypothetical protein